MSEILFSVIGDDNESIGEITKLAKEYEDSSQTAVNITRLPWNRAWQTLFLSALEGKDIDLAQVGTTWVPTLAAVDSLRPFSDIEAHSIGGANSFIPAAWETVQIEKGRKIWAIPWSIYTFVIYYRRDLLQKAGLDETIAFSTPEEMVKSFAALKKAEIPPWVIPTKSNYLDLPHIASSWVRAYGGDFIQPSGKQVLFNTPDSRRGLINFFELYRYIPASLHRLDYESCIEEFFQKGNTAVLIAGTEAYHDALEDNLLFSGAENNIGVATLPGISWIGGDHLVVWKTVQLDPEKEQSAIDLIRSLTSTQSQVRLHRDDAILPARLEAYAELDYQPKELKLVLEKILQTGRPHPPISLWRRTESMLMEMLGEIAQQVLKLQTRSVAEIVENKLSEHEKRFSLIMDQKNIN